METVNFIYVLRQNTKRYSEIQHKRSGISKKMLTQTLSRLESENIIKSTVYPVVSPKTEYNGTVNSVRVERTDFASRRRQPPGCVNSKQF